MISSKKKKCFGKLWKCVHPAFDGHEWKNGTSWRRRYFTTLVCLLARSLNVCLALTSHTASYLYSLKHIRVKTAPKKMKNPAGKLNSERERKLGGKTDGDANFFSWDWPGGSKSINGELANLLHGESWLLKRSRKEGRTERRRKCLQEL